MKRVEDTTAVSPADAKLLAEVKLAITSIQPSAMVMVYGSAARGERQPDSDYDILVLLPSRLPRDEERRLRSAVYAIEREHDTVISLNIETRERWDRPMMTASPYRQSVEREGVLL